MRDDIKELIEELKYSYGIAMPKQEYFGDIKGIEDYITNLQKEHDSWKRVATKNFNDAEDYKSRIDKAVEYIKRFEGIIGLYDANYDGEYDTYYHYDADKELLNILNGRNDE